MSRWWTPAAVINTPISVLLVSNKSDVNILGKKNSSNCPYQASFESWKR